jgi:hypothetical protein
VTHPFLLCLAAISIAHLGSRIVLSPKEPFHLRHRSLAARRVLLEAILLSGMLSFSKVLFEAPARTAAWASAYVAFSLINELVWGAGPKGKGQYVGTYLLQTVSIVFLAHQLSRAQWRDLYGLQLEETQRWRILVVILVYLVTIFLGGRFIRRLIRGLGIPPITNETSTQLQDAGLYIGWLERFLVLTALCMQAPAMVGLIITAKSLARFPEFKEPRFAEYFLVGTLLSLVIAVLGGLVLIETLYGTLSVK